LLEVEVLEAPQVRYTQDNQTPVAEMTVRFEGLRLDDPPGQIKVVGWGSLAQDLQNRVESGQRLMLEGRMRMNTVSRPDGVKEKRAEFTLSRFHPLGPAAAAREEGRFEAAPSAPPSPRAASAAPLRRPGGAAPSRPEAPNPAPAPAPLPSRAPSPEAPSPEAPVWNASPLVADPEGFSDEDDIPF
jgi:single-stranded DNA-binding protein